MTKRSRYQPVFKRISLRRTMCFGPCPVYEVVIRDDGRVEYSGERHVAVEGRHTWDIPKSRVKALSRAIEKVDFLNMAATNYGYPVKATDGPGTVTHVEYRDGQTHTIKDIDDETVAPNALDWLNGRIDLLAGTAPYVKGGEKRILTDKEVELAVAADDAEYAQSDITIMFELMDMWRHHPKYQLEPRWL